MPESELEALDILESVPKGLYRRDTFLVLGEDGEWHRADLYRVSTHIAQLVAIRKTLG